MKPTIKVIGLLLLGATFWSGCGENADANSVQLYHESFGVDTVTISSTLDVTAPYDEDVRSTFWVAFGTMQRNDNPWDQYNDEKEGKAMVGGVTIAFQVNGSFLELDDFAEDGAGDLVNDSPLPIVLVNSAGRVMGTQFEAKTDDVGKYWLGISVLRNGCRGSFSYPVTARVMDQVSTVQVTIESALGSGADCSGL